MSPRKLLIVDDAKDIIVAGRLLLKAHFDDIVSCEHPEDIPQLMATHSFDIILLDMNFGPGDSSGDEGFHWLKHILRTDPDATVVMITAHGGVNLAVEAMKQGATDFVLKPWQNEKLIATLSAAAQLRLSRVEARDLRRVNRALNHASVDEPVMIGQSAVMKTLNTTLHQVAPSEANVLILGENGTGKELVARTLHKLSPRSEQVFMAVDLGAVSESLFESELFGHKKGAFTDAREDRIGRFEAANGGTLFLDEIGNLALYQQAKLLTVLERRQIVPLGSNEARPIDVRVISASNVSRERMANEDLFRQDLLFRLNTVEIVVPPLRERPGDIEAIATYYAKFYARKYHKQHKQFSAPAMSSLIDYHWPGNVRALRHTLERAVIMSQDDMYEPWDFALNPAERVLDRSPLTSKALDSMDERQISPAEHTLNLQAIECKAIRQAMLQSRNNITSAAKILGLTRAALYRRLRKHGL